MGDSYFQGGKNESFNSLQTGKRIWTLALVGCDEATTMSFNSLQTGKRIWTDYGSNCGGCFATQFQFPSNGKAYLNSGKVSLERREISFNSLQTGKRIWTKKACLVEIVKTMVSIPFKRESVSEPGKSGFLAQTIEFQFPSNGKAYLNAYSSCPHSWALITFQFPSNGKAYLNWLRSRGGKSCPLVSIPFKRESVSELRKEACKSLGGFVSFNSLQTGKRIWTDYRARFGGRLNRFQFPSNGKAYLNISSLKTGGLILEFQFPSNGKAYLNDCNIQQPPLAPLQVSIPFKRESVSEQEAQEA